MFLLILSVIYSFIQPFHILNIISYLNSYQEKFLTYLQHAVELVPCHEFITSSGKSNHFDGENIQLYGE